MCCSDSLVRIVVIMLLFVSACSQSPTAFVVTAPQEVIVNSTPAKEIIVEPEPVTEELITQDNKLVNNPDSSLANQPGSKLTNAPDNKSAVSPAPEVIIVPAQRPIIDLVASCIKGCTMQCDLDATNACSQGTNADCKYKCGKIIDPSACAIACSFRRAGSCKEKFRNFCFAQCEAECH